ncbi:hypothetical protein GCK72_008615 [Caenorhabditis remanei]|uniref:RING-type domain-containing protein n=1 Tax=Caenorhabditis remanei TaxID=31234 RepID=A0A6A5H0R1_CAERE|nr:hypothetical protein GCK72_008615 [Caenorhabditis remanei]KAF1760366.1 hypothetical protein GCK72_008615 [Caenorhabditis remanei]
MADLRVQPTDYSELLEEIFRRIATEGDSDRNRDSFRRWTDIFSRPDIAPGRKSFKSLRLMKKEHVNKQDKTDVCAICLDNVCNPVDIPQDFVLKEELRTDEATFRESIVIMPCNHRFHYFCLTLWLEKEQTCPTCRAKVKTDGELEIEERERNLAELHDSMYG